MAEDMERLEEKIGYAFKDKSLLATALTHSSYSSEKRADGAACNERLEFLGDSVLGFTVAEYLYKRRPNMSEGQMTRVRAELVCEKTLLTAALEIGLGGHMILGRGEELTGGRERPSILADAMEALFAAVYLDGGSRAATRLIQRLIASRLDDAEKSSRDYKSELQEYAQGAGQTLIYKLVEESGPDHRKVFRVEAEIGGRGLAFGEGVTKKAAEKEAAKAAFEKLGSLIPG
ncbi:MAG: ribonuclease III [Oscillospiraceae bacterium]|jgi:ribonuclease-3|nr:ribonuclease III [Oscillospiraceae bacterium]